MSRRLSGSGPMADPHRTDPGIVRTPADHPNRAAPFVSRTVFAAAHVVADPFADTAPGRPRRHRLGRHPRLPPPPVVERPWRGRSHGHRAARHGTRLGLGGRADPAIRRRGSGGRRSHRMRCRHGPTGSLLGEPGRHQSRLRGAAGPCRGRRSQAIVMASRHLAAAATSAESYAEVYGHLLRQAAEPVILHWLGPMFDRRWRGTGAARSWTPRPTRSCRSSPSTRPRWTA